MAVVEEHWDGVDTCALGALGQNEGFACDPLPLPAAPQSCSPVQYASRALAERCRWPPVDTCQLCAALVVQEIGLLDTQMCSCHLIGSHLVERQNFA